MIYFDYAATTKPKQEVIDTMFPYFTDKWKNPSSLYSENIKNDIQNVRKKIANYINATEDEIYFTSGGSESNNWAIQGFVKYCYENGKYPAIITSRIEHKSIIECVKNMSMGANIFFVNVDKKGFVDEEQLQRYLSYLKNAKYTTLVSIQFANNEIGTIQNIKRLSQLSHSYEATFHTDAVQAFGKINIDVNYCGIDLMSVSGHKIGCPKGIGFLYIRNGIKIKPLIYGTQENGMRGGTENVPYIIGMGKAIELLPYYDIKHLSKEFCQNEIQHFIAITKLNEYLVNNLGCKINGCLNNLNRIHGIMSYTFPENININIESMILMLNMDDIYISAGSACNSHSNKPSYVLKAIGLTDDECSRTMRISYEYGTLTIDIVNKFISCVEKTIKILKSEVEM